jgi:hypothetical protein
MNAADGLGVTDGVTLGDGVMVVDGDGVLDFVTLTDAPNDRDAVGEGVVDVVDRGVGDTDGEVDGVGEAD